MLNHGHSHCVKLVRDLDIPRLRQDAKCPPKQQFSRAVELSCRPQRRPVDIARQPTLRLWAGPAAAEPDEARTGAASKDPGRCPHPPLLAGYGRSGHGFRPVRRLNRQDDDQQHGPSAPCSYHNRARCVRFDLTTRQASNQMSNYRRRSQRIPVDVSGPFAAVRSHNTKAQASMGIP